MNRSQKEAQVAELRQTFEAHHLMVITHQTGLTVAEATVLRNQMRDAGAKFRVTKNRLAKIAIKGSKFEQLADQFSGPTAIAVSEDPVAAAKVVSDFVKTNDKLVILGGGVGREGARCGWCGGTCEASVPRRSAKQTYRCSSGTCWQARQRNSSTRGPTCPGIKCLR